MTKTTLALLLAALLSGGLAYAQDESAKPGDPAKEPKEAKEAKMDRMVGEEMVSPDAANAVDQEDLLRKLTGETKDDKNEGGAKAKLKNILDRMGQSSKRLEEKDPGEVTQEIQRRIVMDLDVLIDMAKKSQSNSSQNQSEGKGQKKQPSNGGQKTGKGQNRGGNTPAGESTFRENPSEAAPGTDIHEKGTEWGGLPPRDRDFVANGSKEDMLPSYRTLIQRYYEALANMSRATQK